MGEGPAHELARADAMMSEADDLERRASALRRGARQIRARHHNHPIIEALNKALDEANGDDP